MYVFSLSIKTQNDMSDIYVLKELYIYFETRRLLWINLFMMATVEFLKQRISITSRFLVINQIDIVLVTNFESLLGSFS